MYRLPVGSGVALNEKRNRPVLEVLPDEGDTAVRRAHSVLRVWRRVKTPGVGFC
jgi:hypothetical protein